MTKEDWALIQDLFEAGLSLNPSQQEALLADRCTNDGVKDEVRGLWRHAVDDPTQPDLEGVRRLACQLLEQTPEDPPPEGLDRYKILEPIGKGGMGVVYKAEQRYPVKRLVALKVLPLGSCSPERLQRFQAEQQALALLDHPNVVSVYDSGETPEGQPFYVMAYLPGQPMTVWCDQQRLTIEQRLRLFLGVCRGLAQAHRKGIIHRDINPSNVLAAMGEDGPVARIIDFGIARFTQTDQLEQPVQTALGVMMGTPGYMSPEQAAGSGEADVDTLSDIYGLGALLYELLTGASPLGKAASEADSLEELYRITRNFPPPPPTARIQDPEAASARSTTPELLEKTVRGELEWMVMKAIARKPEDRYASCDDLARDIEHYLEGRPVDAAPVNRFYRIRKLISFHRRAVLLSTAFLALLLTAVIFISTSLWRALAAEARTQQTLSQLEAVQQFTQGIFGDVNPARTGKEVTGYELLERADQQLARRYRDQPELEAHTRMVLGSSYKGLGLMEEARTQYRRALSLREASLGEDHEQTLLTVEHLAYVLAGLGDAEVARLLYHRAVRVYEARFGGENARSLNAAAGLAHALGQCGRTEEGLARFAEVLAVQERVLGPDHRATTATRHNYANLLLEGGRLAEAERLMAHHHPELTTDPVLALRMLHNQAHLLQKRRMWEDATALYRDVLTRRRALLGDHHPETLQTLNNLAAAIGDGGQPLEAALLLERVLYGGNPQTSHPVYFQLRHNLGHFLMTAGRHQQAREVLTCVYQDRNCFLGEGHEDTLLTLWTLTETLQALDLADRTDFEAVLEKARRWLGPNHGDVRLYESALK